jgi:pyruvate/2-oxoglutarate/acetoin dehydrogenase E1 component
VISQSENSLYVQKVNQKILDFLKESSPSAVFGQNIISGSRLGGLGKGLDQLPNVMAINSTNSENALCGMGFGLSLKGIPSMFLMKQHDFSLLALDQLVNTYNSIRGKRMLSPFVLFMVVVDSGFEGPQASLNSLDEYASLTKAQVHYLITIESIERTFELITKPDLHIVVIAQSLLKKNMYMSESEFLVKDDFILFQNKEELKQNKKSLIVNFGVNLDAVTQFQELTIKNSKNYDLMQVTRIHDKVIANLLEMCRNYKNVIILDNGKSLISFSQKLALNLSQERIVFRYFPRIHSKRWSEVNDDSHEVTPEEILESMTDL